MVGMTAKARRTRPDSDRIIAAQVMRAVAYGLGAPLLGSVLAARHTSAITSGLILGEVSISSMLSSIMVGRYADRIGRKISYTLRVIHGDLRQLRADRGVGAGEESCCW